jgi:hypothetical protein
MRQAEHVGGLVGEHLTTASQQDCLVIGRALLAIKGRIVSREAEHGDALCSEACPNTKFQAGSGYKSSIVIARAQNASGGSFVFRKRNTSVVRIW